MSKKNKQLTAEEANHSQLEMNRRNFLIGSALGLGGVLMPQSGLAADILNCRPEQGNLLQRGPDSTTAEATAPCVVYIFLRGGMDGLSLAAPATQDTANYNLYRTNRPDLHLQSGIRLGSSQLMLHPNLADLHRNVFARGKLAVIQGAGSPNNTRSHFDQMNFVESGTPLSVGNMLRPDGFLNRILSMQGADIQAASMQSVVPRAINGSNPAVALNGNVNRFVAMSAPGVQLGVSLTDRLLGLFDRVADGNFCAPAQASSLAVQRAQAIVQNARSYDGISPLTAYIPAGVPGGLGSQLRETARLLKGSPGTRAVAIDVGGWDTHASMGVREGYFANRMLMLNHALATFFGDLQSLGLGNRVVTVLQTEFGRPLKQNGSLGLDHGRGSTMLVMGNTVKGGAFVRDWDLSRLEETRDVRVTIDYRDVLGQVIQKHLKANLATAFPGYTLNTSGVAIL